jgi:hypothetical protein
MTGKMLKVSYIKMMRGDTMVKRNNELLRYYFLYGWGQYDEYYKGGKFNRLESELIGMHMRETG